MYELPVENETAKTYFVDNPYTYRSRILKKDIGIVIENSFGNMQVYLEDNDFSKARTIFAAYNMDKLENAKRKVDMFREINASLTHTDVLESKINELSEIEKDKIYRYQRKMQKFLLKVMHVMGNMIAIYPIGIILKI